MLNNNIIISIICLNNHLKNPPKEKQHKKNYEVRTVSMKQKRKQMLRDIKKIAHINDTIWKWKGHSNPMCDIKPQAPDQPEGLSG